MKTLQIHLGLLVISLCFLLACKALPKEETLDKETYEVINTVLNEYKDASRPFVIIEETTELTIDEFKNHMDGQKVLKDQGYHPDKCAMCYIESDVELNTISNSLETWDKLKITRKDISYISRKKLGSKLSMKQTSELFEKKIIRFSNPIFDKEALNAVILTDISQEGQTLHFLNKKEGMWKIFCGYHISYY